MSNIEFQGFSAYYRRKKQMTVAVNNVSFKIKDGEFIVIIGASGCGKTTLLNCLTGGIKYTTGKIIFNGEDINQIPLQQRSISYITQSSNLYPNMTVFDNIAFPLRMMHADNNETIAQVNKIAKDFNVFPLLSRKPRQLSGGQIQRVELARAFIKNPNTVLFDEPFSGLDPDSRIYMRGLIKTLHKRYRSTFIFVTHELQEAFVLADRIIVMEDGKVKAIGTPNEIRDNPTLDIYSIGDDEGED